MACFKSTPFGLEKFGKFYSFDLSETTPPAGPAGSVSHVLFSADGSKLHASAKGVPGSSVGFIATWDVDRHGNLSPTFTKTYPPTGDGLLVFGMANIVGVPTAVMATDPALGLTIYDFSKKKTRFVPLNIPNQVRTCWAVYSKTTESYWITDLGTVEVYEVAVDTRTLEPSLSQRFQLPLNFNVTDLSIGNVGGRE